MHFIIFSLIVGENDHPIDYDGDAHYRLLGAEDIRYDLRVVTVHVSGLLNRLGFGLSGLDSLGVDI